MAENHSDPIIETCPGFSQVTKMLKFRYKKFNKVISLLMAGVFSLTSIGHAAPFDTYDRDSSNSSHSIYIAGKLRVPMGVGRERTNEILKEQQDRSKMSLLKVLEFMVNNEYFLEEGKFIKRDDFVRETGYSEAAIDYAVASFKKIQLLVSKKIGYALTRKFTLDDVNRIYSAAPELERRTLTKDLSQNRIDKIIDDIKDIGEAPEEAVPSAVDMDASGLRRQLRLTPLLPGRLSRRMLSEQTRIKDIFNKIYIQEEYRKRGISESLFNKAIERFSHHMVQVYSPEQWRPIDENVLKKLASLILSDIYGYVRSSKLTSTQVYQAVCKLSSEQVKKLVKTYPRTIVSSALETANPIKSAEIFNTNYQKVENYLISNGIENARTFASKSFTAPDPIETADRYVEAYNEILSYVEKEGYPHIARTIASQSFNAPLPLKKAERYLLAYIGLIKYLKKRKPGEDIKEWKMRKGVARMLASAAFTSSKPVTAADKHWKRYLYTYNTIYSLGGEEIAKLMAGKAYRTTDYKSYTKRYYSKYNKVINYFIGTGEEDIARTIAGKVFTSGKPIQEAKRMLGVYKKMERYFIDKGFGGHAKTLATRILRIGSPIEETDGAAARYDELIKEADDAIERYNEIKAYLEKRRDDEDDALWQRRKTISGTIALEASVTRTDYLKLADTYVERYEWTREYVISNGYEEIANMVANICFPALSYKNKAKNILKDYEKTITYLEEKSKNEPDRLWVGKISPRHIAQKAIYNRTSPLTDIADTYVDRFEELVGHLEKLGAGRIAVSIAQEIFFSDKYIEEAERMLYNHSKIAEYCRTRGIGKGALGIASTLFRSRRPIKDAAKEVEASVPFKILKAMEGGKIQVRIDLTNLKLFFDSLPQQYKELINLSGLTDQEIDLLELRTGIRFDSPYTLEEVGKQDNFKMTREGVRQIEGKVLIKINNYLKSQYPTRRPVTIHTITRQQVNTSSLSLRAKTVLRWWTRYRDAGSGVPTDNVKIRELLLSRYNVSTKTVDEIDKFFASEQQSKGHSFSLRSRKNSFTKKGISRTDRFSVGREECNIEDTDKINTLTELGTIKPQGFNTNFTIRGPTKRRKLITYLQENLPEALTRSGLLHEGKLPENITIVLADNYDYLAGDHKDNNLVILNASDLEEMVKNEDFINEIITSLLSEELAHERGAAGDMETEKILAAQCAFNSATSLRANGINLREYMDFVNIYGASETGDSYTNYLAMFLYLTNRSRYRDPALRKLIDLMGLSSYEVSSRSVEILKDFYFEGNTETKESIVEILIDELNSSDSSKKRSDILLKLLAELQRRDIILETIEEVDDMMDNINLTAPMDDLDKIFSRLTDTAGSAQEIAVYIVERLLNQHNFVSRESPHYSMWMRYLNAGILRIIENSGGTTKKIAVDAVVARYSLEKDPMILSYLSELLDDVSSVFEGADIYIERLKRAHDILNGLRGMIKDEDLKQALRPLLVGDSSIIMGLSKTDYGLRILAPYDLLEKELLSDEEIGSMMLHEIIHAERGDEDLWPKLVRMDDKKKATETVWNIELEVDRLVVERLIEHDKDPRVYIDVLKKTDIVHDELEEQGVIKPTAHPDAIVTPPTEMRVRKLEEYLKERGYTSHFSLLSKNNRFTKSGKSTTERFSIGREAYDVNKDIDRINALEEVLSVKPEGSTTTFSIRSSRKSEDLVYFFKKNPRMFIDALDRSGLLHEGKLPKNITIVLADKYDYIAGDHRKNNIIILNASDVNGMMRGVKRAEVENTMYISELITSCLSEELAHERGASGDAATEERLAQACASNTVDFLVDKGEHILRYIDFVKRYGGDIEGHNGYLEHLRTSLKSIIYDYEGKAAWEIFSFGEEHVTRLITPDFERLISFHNATGTYDSFKIRIKEILTPLLSEKDLREISFSNKMGWIEGKQYPVFTARFNHSGKPREIRIYCEVLDRKHNRFTSLDSKRLRGNWKTPTTNPHFSLRRHKEKNLGLDVGRDNSSELGELIKTLRTTNRAVLSDV
ncbi:MAG: hypothetical protein RAP41_02400 [Candidatus Orphnella occulta]|nr:hypothetical protein [Candidatus Orphnella occulta]